MLERGFCCACAVVLIRAAVELVPAVVVVAAAVAVVLVVVVVAGVVAGLARCCAGPWRTGMRRRPPEAATAWLMGSAGENELGASVAALVSVWKKLFGVERAAFDGWRRPVRPAAMLGVCSLLLLNSVALAVEAAAVVAVGSWALVPVLELVLLAPLVCGCAVDVITAAKPSCAAWIAFAASRATSLACCSC